MSGEKLEVVDIPLGYTHSITNIGTEDYIGTNVSVKIANFIQSYSKIVNFTTWGVN